MTINVEITEKELRKMVLNYISELTNFPVREEDVLIKVRSKQNYRDKEWENGEFKAVYKKES